MILMREQTRKKTLIFERFEGNNKHKKKVGGGAYKKRWG
jgi:hypothetical protein